MTDQTSPRTANGAGKLLRTFFPFLDWMGEVSKSSMRADFVAGLTGAVIVLPQGIAFAAIAGLPPEYGLYTAMITPIIAALFGSSRHLISGPTTAISIVVFAAVSSHAEPETPRFVEIALTLTFMAGIYQLVFGLARLGRIVNFISHNVVVGFTTGAALLIAESQLKNVLGVQIPSGESFIHTIVALYERLGDTNFYALAIAGVTLATAIVVKRFWPRMPHLLFAMAAGSLFCLAINGASHDVTLVSAIPRTLPPPSTPDFSFDVLRSLAPEALAIALLGLIEAVSISRSIAAKSRQRIDGDQEFMGQGLSNIVGSFFSSYAGSGSFTRSGVNYESGAKTPLSAIFAAVILMVIVLLAAPLAVFIPIPAMGAVILLVAYNLIQPKYIRKVMRISRRETSVLLVTFFATLLLDLEFAIYAGVLLSLTLFLMRTSTPAIVAMAPDPASPKHRMSDVAAGALTECPQVKILRVDMSIYFGSLDHIQRRLADVAENEGYRHLLILGDGINFIDMAGAEMLVQEARRFRSLGGGLYFCGVKPTVCDYLKRSGFAEEFGMDNLFFKKNEAIAEVTQRINHDICRTCQAKIFLECDALASGQTPASAEEAGRLRALE